MWIIFRYRNDSHDIEEDGIVGERALIKKAKRKIREE